MSRTGKKAALLLGLIMLLAAVFTCASAAENGWVEHEVICDTVKSIRRSVRHCASIYRRYDQSASGGRFLLGNGCMAISGQA